MAEEFEVKQRNSERLDLHNEMNLNVDSLRNSAPYLSLSPLVEKQQQVSELEALLNKKILASYE